MVIFNDFCRLLMIFVNGREQPLLILLELLKSPPEAD